MMLLGAGVALSGLENIPLAIAKNNKNSITLPLNKNPNLKKLNSPVTFNLPDGTAGAVLLTKKGYIALNLACTHMGTEVVRVGTLWSCPAHGSQFSIDGKLITGPAATPLNKIKVVQNKTSLTIG